MKMSAHYISLRAVVSVLCCLVGYAGIAQQEWTSTQYLFNLYDVNAAYAGNHHALSTAMRHRTQWIGMEGAPSTQMLSMHAPLAGEKLGWGMRIQRESIGAREQWNARGSMAYRVQMGNGVLSMALAGGILRQEIDPNGITAQDWNDPQLNGQRWTSTSLLADAALFYHTTRWFAGVEANRINRAPMNWSPESKARSFSQANIIAGQYFKVGPNDLISLTGIVRVTENGMAQAELNVCWLWNNKLWMGGGYRVHSGPVVIAECNVTKQFRIGYAYDMHVGALRQYQQGSHEVFIGYNLKPRDDRSIRYF